MTSLARVGEAAGAASSGAGVARRPRPPRRRPLRDDGAGCLALGRGAPRRRRVARDRPARAPPPPARLSASRGSRLARPENRCRPVPFPRGGGHDRRDSRGRRAGGAARRRGPRRGLRVPRRPSVRVHSVDLALRGARVQRRPRGGSGFRVGRPAPVCGRTAGARACGGRIRRGGGGGGPASAERRRPRSPRPLGGGRLPPGRAAFPHARRRRARRRRARQRGHLAARDRRLGRLRDVSRPARFPGCRTSAQLRPVTRGTRLEGRLAALARRSLRIDPALRGGRRLRSRGDVSPRAGRGPDPARRAPLGGRERAGLHALRRAPVRGDPSRRRRGVRRVRPRGAREPRSASRRGGLRRTRGRVRLGRDPAGGRGGRPEPFRRRRPRGGRLPVRPRNARLRPRAPHARVPHAPGAHPRARSCRIARSRRRRATS